MTEDETCEQCGHADGPHALVATDDGNPLKGGIRLCPEKGCQCYATWGVPQLGVMAEDVHVPSRLEIDAIRTVIQGMPGVEIISPPRATTVTQLRDIGGSVNRSDD